jgi:hypothetical protein
VQAGQAFALQEFGKAGQAHRELDKKLKAGCRNIGSPFEMKFIAFFLELSRGACHGVVVVRTLGFRLWQRLTLTRAAVAKP